MDDFQRWDFWYREIYVKVEQEVEEPFEDEDDENEKGA
jgi:hypothetical protein